MVVLFPLHHCTKISKLHLSIETFPFHRNILLFAVQVHYYLSTLLPSFPMSPRPPKSHQAPCSLLLLPLPLRLPRSVWHWKKVPPLLLQTLGSLTQANAVKPCQNLLLLCLLTLATIIPPLCSSALMPKPFPPSLTQKQRSERNSGRPLRKYPLSHLSCN